MDVIKQKLDEPVKCPRCGAGPDDECVCMPTDDGPDQAQDQVEEQQVDERKTDGNN